MRIPAKNTRIYPAANNAHLKGSDVCFPERQLSARRMRRSLWIGRTLGHMTERGKQEVFPAAAKDGFTAFRNVTRSPSKSMALKPVCEAQ